MAPRPPVLRLSSVASTLRDIPQASLLPALLLPIPAFTGARGWLISLRGDPLLLGLAALAVALLFCLMLAPLGRLRAAFSFTAAGAFILTVGAGVAVKVVPGAPVRTIAQEALTEVLLCTMVLAWVAFLLLWWCCPACGRVFSLATLASSGETELTAERGEDGKIHWIATTRGERVRACRYCGHWEKKPTQSRFEVGATVSAALAGAGALALGIALLAIVLPLPLKPLAAAPVVVPVWLIVRWRSGRKLI